MMQANQNNYLTITFSLAQINVSGSRGIVDERYGNENVVSTAFTSKLRSWPKINGKVPNSLRMFSDFLLKLITAKKTTKFIRARFCKRNC